MSTPYNTNYAKNILKHSNYSWSARGKYNKILNPSEYLNGKYPEGTKFFSTRLDAQAALKEHYEREYNKKLEEAEKGNTLQNKLETQKQKEQRLKPVEKIKSLINSVIRR